MPVTPLRRLAAGAATTALLAGALLIPAALAAADDLSEASETVQPAVDPTTPEPATASEPPVSEGATGTEAADTPEPASIADIPDPLAAEPAPLTPTAASTDGPQEPQEGAIGPGETATFSYPVEGARFVYVYAIGDDLAVTVVRADGSRLPVPSNGSVHSNDYYWIGQIDGVWKIEITKPWQVALAPLLRPVFAWNHNMVMGWGYADLKTRLIKTAN